MKRNENPYIFFLAEVAWWKLYFSIGESVLFSWSLLTAYSFSIGWYRKVLQTTNFFQKPKLKRYLSILPLTIVVLYLLTLTTVASWDVVDSGKYICLYVAFGIGWLAVSLKGMLLFWSFSYEDDALVQVQPAPLVLLTGALLGSSLIYAGANIGDGPGWWTIVVAGGFGLLGWYLLGALVDKTTGIVTRIIQEYDYNSAFRFAAYLMASGLIVAYASSGDWTSFGMTIIELGRGWPVLFLTIGAIMFERFLVNKTEQTSEFEAIKTYLPAAIYCAYALLVIAVYVVAT